MTVTKHRMTATALRMTAATQKIYEFDFKSPPFAENKKVTVLLQSPPFSESFRNPPHFDKLSVNRRESKQRFEL
jgi:hypothetical protein